MGKECGWMKDRMRRGRRAEKEKMGFASMPVGRERRSLQSIPGRMVLVVRLSCSDAGLGDGAAERGKGQCLPPHLPGCPSLERPGAAEALGASGTQEPEAQGCFIKLTQWAGWVCV